MRYRRKGRNIFYTLDDDHICQLLAVALEHVGHADGAVPSRATVEASGA